ncbi:uncharacterized protein N7511_003598 [Penicillium nucicola]|uniref:uncharacterized protein n=1 Tax=Penicillium nucicola TaxID=1850975 RepID=UPI0025459EA3|nr:uncharacterized protein N7511_003598 [Penicillium nucicola]KAJ5765982.1 hypothetical protein N7511_003598 [Penicillium nucicola]
MCSYAPFLCFSHKVPLSDELQPFQRFGSSLPADAQSVTRVLRTQPSLSLDREKSQEVFHLPQPWWKSEFLSTQPPSYGHSSLCHSGLQIIPGPQSPHSSGSGSLPFMNYYDSSPYQQDDALVSPFDEQRSIHSMPDSLIDLDPSLTLSTSPKFEVYPDKISPFNFNEISQPSCYYHRKTPEALSQAPIPVSSCPKRGGRIRSTSRVCKSTEKRTPSTQGRRHPRAVTSSPESEASRTFICSFVAYGCKSTFTSKNEWKRHFTTKHLLLGFYRCDVGRCNNQTQQMSTQSLEHTSTTPQSCQPNDFNRKDLFTQHQRRMHAPWRQTDRRRAPTDAEHGAFESGLEQVQNRCWHRVRQPPPHSRCGFCGECFSGINSWDARMEHVGRHFERQDPAFSEEEAEDMALREWGLTEGILTLVDEQVCLASLVETER